MYVKKQTHAYWHKIGKLANRGLQLIESTDRKPMVLDNKLQSVQTKPDIIQIAIAISIFAAFLYIIFSTFGIASLISVLFAGGLVFYQIMDWKSPKSIHRHSSNRLSTYTITMIAMPFVIATAIAYDGYVNWQSIAKGILVWGMTFSFWYSLLFVPLAIRSKHRESILPEPTIYPSMSILMPAYNEEKVIGRSIESLVHADYPDKEIIVIDDGSGDRTLEIANKYKPQIKILHKEHGGKASALNYGLVFARGEIIVIVDADTIIGNNALRMITKEFSRDEVVAVAGNVKIKNLVNLLTWCQALEYLTSIQIMRRGLDYFGAIGIVPGALGAFRRKALRQVGEYTNDTLVEDFDTTVKVLKSGFVIQGSNDAVAYTQVPQTLKNFCRQRKRWYRGNLQNVIKHRDVLTNPRFGFLHKITYPLMIIQMLVVPFTGFLVWAFAAINIMQGEGPFVLSLATFFIIIQYLLTALSVRVQGDDKKIIAYSIFALIGYKQIVDFLSIKAVLEEVFKRKASWTSAERVR